MTKIEVILLVIWFLKILQLIITIFSYTSLTDLEKRFTSFNLSWSDNLIWTIPIYIWL